MKQVRYTLTEQDLLSAARLHDRTFNFIRLAMFAALLPVLYTSYLIVTELMAPEEASLSRVLIPGGILAVATALALLIVWEFRQRVTLRRIARNMLAGNIGLRREQTVRWDDARFEFATEKGQSSEDPANFTKWLATKETFLLFRGDYSYQVVPARAFDTANPVEDLIRVLETAGVRGMRAGR